MTAHAAAVDVEGLGGRGAVQQQQHGASQRAAARMRDMQVDVVVVVVVLPSPHNNATCLPQHT